jgi:hypothetical protein
VRTSGSGTVPPRPAFVDALVESNPILSTSISLLGMSEDAMLAAEAEASAGAGDGDAASASVTAEAAPAAAAAPAPAPVPALPPSKRAADRRKRLASTLVAGQHGIASNDSQKLQTSYTSLVEEGLLAQHALQSACDEAATHTELPWRALSASLKAVCGDRITVLTPTGPRATIARVVPSTSELICDGFKPATLLGAIPGLSATAMATHAASLDSAQLRCGLRLICKSYELDVLAPTAKDAREWTRGINHLPLGGKHRQLLILTRKHAGLAQPVPEGTPPTAAVDRS